MTSKCLLAKRIRPVIIVPRKAVHTTELTESPEINALKNNEFVTHWLSRLVFIAVLKNYCAKKDIRNDVLHQV